MKKIFANIITFLLLFLIIYIPVKGEDDSLSYKDVKGITREEIAAIEELQQSGRKFTFGALLSTEAFYDENGKIQGYLVNLSTLLTDLFEIEFKPTIYGWKEMIKEFDNGAIDFSDDITLAKGHTHHHIMSEPVSVRSLAAFYPKESVSLEEIRSKHTPVYGFLRNSVYLEQLQSVEGNVFETVEFKDFQAGIAALENQTIDAFVCDSVFDNVFGEDYFGEVFSPLISNSTAVTTRKEELLPVISVFNKFIADNGRELIAEQYALGMNEYNRLLVRSNLTEQEKEYIDNHINSDEKIPIILESGNYPISFYNEQNKEYEGIVPDLLKQISVLTGLEFEVVNRPEDDWATVLGMLEEGKASLISELLHTEAREGHFLWSAEPACVTNYALLSRSEYPNLEINQILGKRMGVESGTAYQDIAKQWFPFVEILYYNSIDDAFKALDSGEIDLVMASENLLLSQTNYKEKSGYKANLTLDFTAESKIGFNIEEEVLVSIFDKAFTYANNSTNVRHWVTRVFDYSAQLSQTRARLLTISSVFLLAFIALLAVFLIKNQGHRKVLTSTVETRTAQLEEKTVSLSTIYKAIPDLIYSKDLAGKYVSCNPSFEAFAGLTEEEIVGKDVFQILGDQDIEMLTKECVQEQDVISSNKTLVAEEIVTYPNGERRLLETIKSPLQKNGVVVGTMGISRDITAHKESEERAQEANRAKSAFLAKMSHEMRTPLNAIVGMAEITKAARGNVEKTNASVNQIVVSSNHLLSLINDVLDMSKIESGKLEVIRKPFVLKEALEETLSIGLTRCAEKQITFVNNVDQVPGFVVLGDRLRLNQVLINLLSNSAKFTPEKGKIDFIVEMLEETKEDVSIRFSVKDSGIGMTKEQASRLFRPFEQADSSIAQRFGGTGLGLSISYNLVQKMGGTIEIESELGKGSIFSFALMFTKGEEIAETKFEEEGLPNFEGKRILLVDDIDINRLVVEEILSPTLVEITTARDGQEAVNLFEKSEPGYYKLIFMDIQMPIMDGYEATRKIRASSHLEADSIPIIAMTANVYREDIEKAEDAGMTGHLGKPIDVSELMNTLRTHLL